MAWYSYIYIYSSITSINYTLVSYHTHGKQDLKPQVSGLLNDICRSVMTIIIRTV